MWRKRVTDRTERRNNSDHLVGASERKVFFVDRSPLSFKDFLVYSFCILSILWVYTFLSMRFHSVQLQLCCTLTDKTVHGCFGSRTESMCHKTHQLLHVLQIWRHFGSRDTWHQISRTGFWKGGMSCKVRFFFFFWSRCPCRVLKNLTINWRWACFLLCGVTNRFDRGVRSNAFFVQGRVLIRPCGHVPRFAVILGGVHFCAPANTIAFRRCVVSITCVPMKFGGLGQLARNPIEHSSIFSTLPRAYHHLWQLVTLFRFMWDGGQWSEFVL